MRTHPAANDRSCTNLHFRLKFLFFLLLTGTHALSQCVSTIQMNLGTGQRSHAYNVLPAGNGQFYVCARKYYPDKETELFIKMDTLGIIEWEREYFINGLDTVNNYRLASNGGLLIVGANNSNVKDSIVSLRLLATGEIAWSKKFGFDTGDEVIGNDIFQTSDGGFIISGTINSFIPPTSEAFIMKLDANGNAVWGKRFKAVLSPDDIDLPAFGGGVIEKDGKVIFCSAVEGDDLPLPDHLRITRMSVVDGSVIGGIEYIPGEEEEGFNIINIYDDLHDGYYVTGVSSTYRSPNRYLLVLRLDSNLQLINNYHISTPRAGGFSPVEDGFLTTGSSLAANSVMPGNHVINRVTHDGTLLYSRQFSYWSFLFSAPFRHTGIAQIGSQIIFVGAGGGSGDSAFVAAFDATDPIINTCNLQIVEGVVDVQSYDSIPLVWTTIANSLPQGMDNPGMAITAPVIKDTICYYSCGPILAIALTAFNGVQKNQNIHLFFSATDAENYSFVVEKGFDRNSFSAISRISALAGLGEKQYSYVDSNVVYGANSEVYYRIKLLGADGSFQYSRVCAFSLKNFEDAVVRLYPNPAREFSRLEIGVPANGIMDVTIKNQHGQKVSGQRGKVNKGINYIPLSNINLLPPGIYYVEVSINGQRFVKKLLLN